MLVSHLYKMYPVLRRTAYGMAILLFALWSLVTLSFLVALALKHGLSSNVSPMIKPSSSFSWGLSMALGAFIVGLGKFLDDYHLSSNLKTRTRERLKLILTLLERPRLPRFERVVPRLLMVVYRKLGVFSLIIVAIAIYLFVVELATRNGPAYNGMSLASRLTLPLRDRESLYFTAMNLAICITGIAAIVHCFSRIDRARTIKSQIVWSLLSLLAAINIVSLSFFIFLINWRTGGSHGGNLFFSFLLLEYGVCIVAGLVALLCIAKLTIELTRWLSVQVFSAASGPDTSPFLYGSALLSILLLLGKIVVEVVG